MTDDDRIRYSLKRRPHYSYGDKVRIALDAGPYTGVIATVRDVSALQSVGNPLVTYIYTLELPNLARIKLSEEHIAPLPSGINE